MQYSTTIRTELGDMTAVYSDDHLQALFFTQASNSQRLDSLYASHTRKETSLSSFTVRLQQNLDAYFAGELTEFNIPLQMEGTDFQRKAWEALQQIPYGQTYTYTQQAQAMNVPKAVRAVGSANAKNPISIILPCHRVVPQNAKGQALTAEKIGGYAGGQMRKQALLRTESVFL